MGLQVDNDTSNGSHIGPIVLDLEVTDREVVEELQKLPSRDDRHRFSLSALRVGVLAIRQASGVLDGRTVRDEAERLIRTLGQCLSEHASHVEIRVSAMLKQYFDPASGELPQRLDRLVRGGGELESLLNRHVNGDGSILSQTLEKHLGSESPLLQAITPDERKGIVASLREALLAVLADHGQRVSKQFSLDDKESALSRLVSEITDRNGSLRKDFAADLEKVCKEFSLDNGDGALARLVDRVERANRTILAEFSADNAESALSRLTKVLEATRQSIDSRLSLDQEDSPLSRLRRELMNVVVQLTKSNDLFREEVRTCLEAMRVRREEAARSTTHGFDFEHAVGQFIQKEAERHGDLFEETHDLTGSIQRCKAGDFVLTLGPENVASGYRVAFEAKQDKSYGTKAALDELQRARENRKAHAGVFVFSKASAPDGMEPLGRWGQDIIVIWDALDPNTDVNLRAGISLARLILAHKRADQERATADVEEMEAAIDAVTRDLVALDEISRLASSVRSSGDSIGSKAATLKKKVEVQIDRLREHVAGLGSNLSG